MRDQGLLELKQRVEEDKRRLRQFIIMQREERDRQRHQGTGGVETRTGDGVAEGGAAAVDVVSVMVLWLFRTVPCQLLISCVYTTTIPTPIGDSCRRYNSSKRLRSITAVTTVTMSLLFCFVSE